MEPELRRPTTAVIVAGVSIVLLVAALIWGVAQARDAAEKGSVAHAALCIQYEAYVAQRAQGEHLLATQHGRLIHYAGLALTRSAIERSVRIETTQINALAILHCSK